MIYTVRKAESSTRIFQAIWECPEDCVRTPVLTSTYRFHLRTRIDSLVVGAPEWSREYHTALVSAAVTGQIDVRDAVKK